jgi:hypothetical protein
MAEYKGTLQAVLLQRICEQTVLRLAVRLHKTVLLLLASR